MIKYIIFFFIVLPYQVSVFADFDSEVLKNIDSYVYDEVGVLSSKQQEEINGQIDRIRDKTTAEILVVLLKTTDGEDISSLGVRIGQKVGVGKSDRDNGIVILIATQEREWNISTGYGVEGILPDIRTKRIGEANFPENFRVGNYAGGISGVINDIGGFLEQAPEVISKYEKIRDNDLISFGLFLWMIGLFFTGYVYKKNEKQRIRFMKYGGITGFTSVALYLLFPALILLIVNFIFHSLVAYLYDKVEWESGDGSNSSGWGSGRNSWGSKSGRSRGGFGGGSFGGGGSRGKW